MAHGFARTRQHQLLAGSIPWHRFSRLFSRWQSPSSLWQGQPAGELTTPSRSVRHRCSAWAHGARLMGMQGTTGRVAWPRRLSLT